MPQELVNLGAVGLPELPPANWWPGDSTWMGGNYPGNLN
eukprot:SAG31_NODE_25370_length_462_cov_1.275482_1_plen_38_part_10